MEGTQLVILVVVTALLAAGLTFVIVKFLDRHGPLTIGYGSPGRTGVELEFGTLMGNHFEEPVIWILINHDDLEIAPGLRQQ